MSILDFLDKGVNKLFSRKPKKEITQGASTAPELKETLTDIKEPEKKSLTNAEYKLFIYQLFEDEHAKQNLERLGRNYQSEELLTIIKNLYDSGEWTNPLNNGGFAACTETIENRVKRSTLEQYIKGGDNQTKQLFGYLKDFDRKAINTNGLTNYYNEIMWVFEWFVRKDQSPHEQVSLDDFIENHHTNSVAYKDMKNNIIEQGDRGYSMWQCADNISERLQSVSVSEKDITTTQITQYNVLVMFIYGLDLLDRPSPILIDPITEEKVTKII